MKLNEFLGDLSALSKADLNPGVFVLDLDIPEEVIGIVYDPATNRVYLSCNVPSAQLEAVAQIASAEGTDVPSDLDEFLAEEVEEEEIEPTLPDLKL